MSLENLYNEYKKHTGDKAEYNSSEFPKKIRRLFSNYGLNQYMSLIAPKRKKTFLEGKHYEFTEEEIEKIGWFLGSATTRFTSGDDKYYDETEMNPFLHAKNSGSVGITDLEKFTRKYIKEGKIAPESDAGLICDKIIVLINFAKELKKCIKRLIVAVFYMKGFNTDILYRVISKLNGFVDELFLSEKLHKYANPSYYDYVNDFYRSIDVLAAADMCDHIYHSRSDNKGRYLDLVTPTDVRSLRISFEEDYKSTLKEKIDRMYRNYVDLLFEGYEDVEIREKYRKTLELDFMTSSIEEIIFDEYVFTEGPLIYMGEIDIDDAIESTYNWVREMIEEAEEAANEKCSIGERYDDALDKLLFKPFIDFHNDDMERLKGRVQNNSKVLPKEMEKCPRSSENNL